MLSCSGTDIECNTLSLSYIFFHSSRKYIWQIYCCGWRGSKYLIIRHLGTGELVTVAQKRFLNTCCCYKDTAHTSNVMTRYKLCDLLGQQSMAEGSVYVYGWCLHHCLFCDGQVKFWEGIRTPHTAPPGTTVRKHPNHPGGKQDWPCTLQRSVSRW